MKQIEEIMPLQNTPPAFHLLAKPIGPICNLDCEYCFYLSKESLYPGERFQMADEILDTYIRQLLKSHRTPEVTVAWQGGEPTLMGLDFFRRSVELVDRYRRPGQLVQYTIQTNGVLLDDQWASFFKEHNFLVGLSVDGPRELHDRYRVDKNGKGSFDRVMDGYKHLQAHDVDVNVLCTVNAANQNHPLEVYRFFRDEMGIRFLQFIPIVERITEPPLPLANHEPNTSSGETQPIYVRQGNHITNNSVDPKAFGQFLIAIFDDWVSRDVGEVFVQMFDAALANWHGEPPGICVFSETCGLAVVLEHNGDLYSCDHFVEHDYRLGNITETLMSELVASNQQRAFGLAKQNTLPQYCQNCEVRFACHGGCPKDRFIHTPDGEAGLNYLCTGFKEFFKHIDHPMRLMSALLRQNRAPAEVSAIIATEATKRSPKTGRNEPCPCGSGFKYKKCHGARERLRSDAI